jgi:hypothetical protein
MKGLHIHAGPKALAHLRRHGLQPQDVHAPFPPPLGGPKGLILGPLDRFIFGDWLPAPRSPVHLVGASIGAWRMATACLPERSGGGLSQRLEHDYIHQHYDPPAGPQAAPRPGHVSERFGTDAAGNFYGGQVDEVLQPPALPPAHRHGARAPPAGIREHRLATPLGYLGAFFDQHGAPQGHGRVAGARGVLVARWRSRAWPARRCPSARATTARARCR